MTKLKVMEILAVSPKSWEEAFKAELVPLIPHVRAFARSLAGRPDSDDLAQDAMLRAWKARASYRPGTSLKAWIFTILRNQFISDNRRSWRRQPLDPVVAENTLIASDDPSSSEELLDVRNAMQLLPDEQRETLILAGPAGLTYEETAKICGCAIGTVKSRVSRARAALAAILEGKSSGPRVRTNVSARQAFEEIMQQATRLRRGRAPGGSSNAIAPNAVHTPMKFHMPTVSDAVVRRISPFEDALPLEDGLQTSSRPHRAPDRAFPVLRTDGWRPAR